jgi:predicted enzyme related to lactoylglutathione lyase
VNNNRDPLTALHGDELPVTPDPVFAARLRARLESALTLPANAEGVVMSGTDTAIAELNSTSSTARQRPAAIPYLAVADARAAIAWYVEALGATVIGEPIVMDDGRVGHAELSLGDGVLYLADEFPEMGLKAPAPQSVSVSLMLPVADTDAVLQRARDHGATVLREAYEDHGARGAAIIDPSGHRWMLSGPMTGGPLQIKHGDVGYVSLWTPDAERAAVFYGRVLGWTYDRQTNQVTNTTLPTGIFAVDSPQTMLCCYAVDNLEGARQAIIDGGGEPGREIEFEFGTVLDAVDPAGAAFAVFKPAPGTPRPALNGTGPGELSYITYFTENSADFRSFYSRVLHWTFESGRIEDGWAVEGSHPMAGIAGGNTQSSTVPMWTVEDIDAAVERVRAAGGTVIEEPSTQSYGKSALCTDDQGARFYLGEH